MSTTHSKRIAKAGSAIGYQRYGARGSAEYKKNILNGTDRVAGMRCDLGSPEEFVDRAEALAKTNGRKIEARGVIQSFSNTEFDPGIPAEVQQVTDLGYEYAKRLGPNSDVMVITHVDGKGGHPHNHITILNHDNVSGKSLQTNNMHYHTQKMNDQLMLERGLEVVEKSLSVDQRSYWEANREGPELSKFDQKLGDDVEECLADLRAVDTPSFRKVLAEKGIELDEKVIEVKASDAGMKPAHESVGWTYKALDETGKKPRKRRRKASSFCTEFTHQGAHEIFVEKKERQARHGSQERHGSTGQDRAAGTGSRGNTAVELLGEHELDVGVTYRPGGDTGRSPEPDGDGAASNVDLAALRDSLAARRVDESSRRAEVAANPRDDGDRADARSDRRDAEQQPDREAAGRKPGKPRRARGLVNDEEARSADDGYGLGD